ncbi:Uncharacterized protein TCM_004365 [Theobroma cacao]|uniref:ATP-dependent DNA helicase n=1 Tax=Theobroma cacao TaxID=3641 RepID=A0A061DQT1_THECC|nr:Uncharacterized protein TCM_004365 [Theobroma cacao]
MPNQGNVIYDHDRLIHEEMNYNLSELQQLHLNLITTLNIEQKQIYQCIKQSVDNDEGQMIFVYGHGGIGKTYLWNTIISSIRSVGKIVLVVASSGIASLLLPRGRTAHSRFKIALDINEYFTCQIKKGTQLARLVQACSLIVWDETPMVHRHCFEALDRTLKDILNQDSNEAIDKPFGGKTLLLGGDFRQILPVIESGHKTDIINATINRSPLWSKCKVFKLKTNMRLLKPNLSEESRKEIETFAQWLLDVGDGNLHSTSMVINDDESDYIPLPNDLLVLIIHNPINDIIFSVYNDFDKFHADPEYLRQRAIVTPYNETTNSINAYALDILPGYTKTYFSHDSISQTSDQVSNHELLYPTEFLNSLKFLGLPDHALHLKIGAL